MRIGIIGATSAIAIEIARVYARQNASLILAARDEVKLKALAADLSVCGASDVTTLPFDVQNPTECLKAFFQQPLDVLIVAHGVLNVTDGICQFVTVNFTSAVQILEDAAIHMTEQGFGTLAAIGSVAGDRGKQSNYVYGACKAGLDTYLSGLRNRLCSKNIHVLTIKPGFVDTPMTTDFDKNGPLWASSSRVAQDIVHAVEKRTNVLYTPWFWRYIMLLIRHIPEALFKRMTL